jgi:titin
VNKLQNQRGDLLPVEWFKILPDGSEEKIYKNSHYEMTKLNKKLILKINNAKLEDSGVYIVKVGGHKAESKLTVNEIPVVFKIPLEDQTGKEGQSCTFECTINRSDVTPKQVKWFINDSYQISREDVASGKYTISQDKKNFQLTIYNLDLRKDNNARVTCQIGTQAKSTAKLTVIEEDIKFIERLTDLGVKENDQAQFVCKLSKLKYETRPNEVLNIKWYIKNKEINPNEENSPYVIEQIDTTLKLTIKAVKGEDAGEVKCVVNQTLSTAADLSVEEEPVVFVRKLTDLTCSEIPGEVKFECELNKSFVNAKWFRNGKEIFIEDSKYDFGREGPKHFLYVKGINGKDEGEYTIVLQIPNEKKCSANLKVTAGPKLFLNSKYKDAITIKRGTPLLLEVNFSGHPEPKLTWSHEDEPVKENSRTKIESVRNNLVTLLVKQTQRSDSGLYQLLLENDYGREKCTIKVNVLDKPSSPRNLKVSENKGEEMVLEWKVPEDDGGSPLTGYVIEMKDFDRKSWNEVETVLPGQVNHTISKLNIGTRYSYRISAENKYGRSEPIEINDPVEAKYPFKVPDVPENCQASEITPYSCLITFDTPKSDGGSPILGYIIERRQTSTARWIRVNRELIPNLKLKCIDLVDGLEYEFRVIAENKAGQSDPSEPCKPFIAKNPYDRPSPPLNVKPGEVTKSSIELVWEPPLNDGGSPITAYKIERRNPKTMKWVPMDNLGRITQCKTTITDGIKEGKEYEFRVVACNAAGDSDPSLASPLIVAKTKIIGDKPTLIEPLKDQRVLVGETARFTCKLKVSPAPEITWSLNERALTYKDDFVSTFDNGTLELTINNAQLKDQGYFKALIKNPLGELDIGAKLTVLKKPTIKYDQRFEKIYDVIAGQNMSITCEVSGSPKPEVKWSKDKLEIVPGSGEVSRAFIDNGELYCSISIKKIKRNEGGVFGVVAENEVGKADASFTVRVIDVPMPPENLKCDDITSSSCKLSWSPPKDDGNSPITAYYIEKYDPKYATWIRLDKTSLCEHFVDKLNKGQSYQFRIIAENRIGLSDPCEMKEPIVARGKNDVPGAPGTPEVSQITHKSCHLTWEPPRKDGGLPIKGYFIERKSGSKWIRLNPKEPVNKCSFDVQDLEEGMEYEFRVCAVNDEGEGAFSRGSESITAKNPYSRPDPPIDAQVSEVTRSSCLLTWRPPFRDGGLPIVRYHVEMRTKGDYKFYRFTDDFISECEYEIRDLVENQDYEFRIIAENKQGESLPSDPTRKFKAKDQIQGVPPEISGMPDQGNLIGTQGKIECRLLAGIPLPTFRWKKGSKTINLESSKYSFSYAQSLAVLYINNLNEEDAGQYTVEAENEYGFDTKSCKFFVYQPPKIEYDSKFKKTNAVTVGSNFRLICQVTGCPKPETTWFKNDFKLKKDDKAIVENPIDDQYYLTIKQSDRNDSGIYVIKASNQYGKAEARFELQIVDVPDQPKGPLEISLDEQAKSATLNWKPPKWDGGSELTGYTIEYAKILEPTISKSKSFRLCLV